MKRISIDQGLAINLVKTKLKVLEKEISEILIKWDQSSASEMIELTKAGKIPESESDAISLTNLQDKRIEFEKYLLIMEEKMKTPSKDVHKHLWSVVEKHLQDYEPYGTTLREGSDCSCGCVWYLPLKCLPHDWGVCTNNKSHRVGKLTFEHQGCSHFVKKKSDDELYVILDEIKENFGYVLKKLANNE